jgi:NitT/TauT family transport system substrate-binding protein
VGCPLLRYCFSLTLRAFIACFLIVSCAVASSNAQAQAASAQRDALTIGIIPIADCAQLYVAQRTIFEKYNLVVERVPLNGDSLILSALGTGAVQVAFSNIASAVLYEQGVGPLKLLSGGTRMNRQYSEAGLVVSADSKINTFADLNDKTIAVNTKRNIVDLAILRALRHIAIKATEVSLIELPFKDMEAALRAGSIDALLCLNRSCPRHCLVGI